MMTRRVNEPRRFGIGVRRGLLWLRQTCGPPYKTKSFLAKYQIDDPAASDVFARLPAVKQDVRVVAAGFFQRIGEDRHAVEGTVGVDAVGEGDNGGRAPCGI